MLLRLRMFLFAAAVPVLLRLKLVTVQALLKQRRATPDPPSVERILAEAPRLGPNCLRRNLTLYYFLRRAGADVSLVFGAGHPDGGFAGHCWLEHGGEPVLESEDPRRLFAEMYRFS